MKTIYRNGTLYQFDKESASPKDAKLRRQELEKQGKRVLFVRGTTLYRDAPPGNRHSIEIYKADVPSDIKLLESRYKSATFPKDPNHWASSISASGINSNDPAVKRFARKHKLKFSGGSFHLPKATGRAYTMPQSFRPTKKAPSQKKHSTAVSSYVKSSKSYGKRINKMLKKIYHS